MLWFHLKVLTKIKKKGVLELSGELTINDIHEAKKTFANAISKSQTLELQFGDADRIDVAYMQVIHSMKKTAVEAEKGFRLSHPLPESVQRTVQAAGMGHLRLWQSP